MKVFLASVFCLLGLNMFGQGIVRQFFTTNSAPIVDVVAGSNATVVATTPASNIRRFSVSGVTDTNVVNALVESGQLWTNGGSGMTLLAGPSDVGLYRQPSDVTFNMVSYLDSAWDHYGQIYSAVSGSQLSSSTAWDFDATNGFAAESIRIGVWGNSANNPIHYTRAATNILFAVTTNGSVISAGTYYGDGSGLTNLPSSGTGSSNITDSGYVAVARNLTVSTNTAFGGSVIATNGYTSIGTNAIYSLWSSGTDYERYLFEPEDTRLTIRADTAGSGDDNLSVRIMPVGTGAFYLENAGKAAGNTRGNYAVDLCMEKGAADEVASGNYSFVVGYRNKAVGQSSSSLGQANNSTGNYSLTVGTGNYAGADGSYALGDSMYLTGSYSWGIGLNNKTTASYSSAVGGHANSTLIGQNANASGRFAADGDAQSSRLSCRVVSASSSQTNLWTDGSSGRLTLPANTSWSFQIQITARSTDAGTGDEESAAYEIKGLIERDNAAANTRLVGSPIVTTLAEDDALWDVSVTADTTNGALQINVQGNNETAVRWVATVHLTEVGG